MLLATNFWVEMAYAVCAAALFIVTVFAAVMVILALYWRWMNYRTKLVNSQTERTYQEANAIAQQGQNFNNRENYR